MDQAHDAAGNGVRLELSQEAKLPSFLGLSLKNGLLNIITLTLYRFWGKTEVRRRIWRTTLLNGEPFEYTGRGKELFIGFLLAIGVFAAPVLVIVFLVQFLGPWALILLLGFYIGIPLLIGLAQFTAFRYLASRTAWRGVRFGLSGKAINFAGVYLGYLLLSGMTMGWFWPEAQRRLSGLLWEKLSFGDRAFSFDMARAKRVRLYPWFALGWILSAIVYLIVMILAVAVTMGAKDQAPEFQVAAQLLLYPVYFVAALLIVIALAAYHAAVLRGTVAGIALDGVRFDIRVSGWDVMGLSLSNIALLVFSLGFLSPFVQARTAKFLINRVTSQGEIDLDSVGQSRAPAPTTGEGLADALGTSLI